MRSGKLVSKNDYLIEEFINDPNYKIERNGNIYTIITVAGNISVSDTWRLAGSIGNQGYRKIAYKGKRLQAHRIIYRKFIGPLFFDLVIDHLNQVRHDNRIENLDLVPQGTNNLMKYRRDNEPPSITNTKINFQIAEEIRKDRVLGMTNKQLREKYKLSKCTISYIINNKIWTRDYSLDRIKTDKAA